MTAQRAVGGLQFSKMIRMIAREKRVRKGGDGLLVCPH
jgi:hypothetical protein